MHVTIYYIFISKPHIRKFAERILCVKRGDTVVQVILINFGFRLHPTFSVFSNCPNLETNMTNDNLIFKKTQMRCFTITYYPHYETNALLITRTSHKINNASPWRRLRKVKNNNGLLCTVRLARVFVRKGFELLTHYEMGFFYVFEEFHISVLYFYN